MSGRNRDPGDALNAETPQARRGLLQLKVNLAALGYAIEPLTEDERAELAALNAQHEQALAARQARLSTSTSGTIGGGS